MPRPAHSTHSRPARLSSSPAGRPGLVLAPLADDSPEQAQLDRILRSRTFNGAHRSQLFLRYIVQHAIAHPGDPVKEYSIAVDVFDRDTYDPAVNNNVRVEAARLRSRLLEYYAGEGHTDPILIEVPKGSYRVLIHPRGPRVAPTQVSLPSQHPQLLPSRQPVFIPRLWAIPVAFLIGALVGYGASHERSRIGKLLVS